LSHVVLAAAQMQVLVLWVPLPGFISAGPFVLSVYMLLLNVKRKQSFDAEVRYVRSIPLIVMMDGDRH